MGEECIETLGPGLYNTFLKTDFVKMKMLGWKNYWNPPVLKRGPPFFAFLEIRKFHQLELISGPIFSYTFVFLQFFAKYPDLSSRKRHFLVINSFLCSFSNNEKMNFRNTFLTLKILILDVYFKVFLRRNLIKIL